MGSSVREAGGLWSRVWWYVNVSEGGAGTKTVLLLLNVTVANGTRDCIACGRSDSGGGRVAMVRVNDKDLSPRLCCRLLRDDCGGSTTDGGGLNFHAATKVKTCGRIRCTRTVSSTLAGETRVRTLGVTSHRVSLT